MQKMPAFVTSFSMLWIVTNANTLRIKLAVNLLRFHTERTVHCELITNLNINLHINCAQICSVALNLNTDEIKQRLPHFSCRCLKEHKR